MTPHTFRGEEPDEHCVYCREFRWATERYGSSCVEAPGREQWDRARVKYAGMTFAELLAAAPYHVEDHQAPHRQPTR